MLGDIRCARVGVTRLVEVAEVRGCRERRRRFGEGGEDVLGLSEVCR